MATIHLAGSVACFVIGGLLVVISGFLISAFCWYSPIGEWGPSNPFTKCMGSSLGVVFVTGIATVVAGVIIAVKSKN